MSPLDVPQTQAPPLPLSSGQSLDRQQHPFTHYGNGFTTQALPRANFAFHLVHGTAAQALTLGTLNYLPQLESGADARGQQLVRALQEQYTIADADSVIIGILDEQRSLYRILMEAVRPLRQAFGERRVLELRAQFSDEDSMLKAVVWLPVNFDDPERSLRSFDAVWWLENCHRSGGALVFDYEIQDAV